MENLKLNQKYRKIILIVLFYVLVSLAMYLIYHRNFIWSGDDTYFHFQRLLGLSANFDHGLLMSNITTDSFGKFGYGINIFYPWVTLMPFQIMFNLTGSWVNAFYQGLWFYFLVSLCISHYSMKRFSGNTKIALIFTIIYNFSIYRLIDIFTRAAWAEYLATLFLPLCFLGFYEIFFGDGKQWKPLAIGLSLIILSHILSTYLSIIMFVVLLIVFYRKIKFSKIRLLNLGKAILATIMATLIFTVPFISEELFQKYSLPDPQTLTGVRVKGLISSSLINNSRKMLEGNTYNVGLVIIFTVLLGFIIFKKLSYTYKSIYVIFVATMFLATDLFPWRILQNTPISAIQLPYRLFMFTTLFGSIIAAKSLTIILEGSVKEHFPVVICLLTLITGGFWAESIDYASKGEYLATPRLTSLKNLSDVDAFPQIYLNQYVPKKSLSEISTFWDHLIYINGIQTQQVPTSSEDGSDFYLTDIKEADLIDLPMVRYKYSRATFNGKEVKVKSSGRGSVQIVAPSNATNVTVHISYGNRWLFGWAYVLSVVTWIWLGGSEIFIRLFRKLKM